jgi:hypothetical protein
MIAPGVCMVGSWTFLYKEMWKLVGVKGSVYWQPPYSHHITGNAGKRSEFCNERRKTMWTGKYVILAHFHPYIAQTPRSERIAPWEGHIRVVSLFPSKTKTPHDCITWRHAVAMCGEYGQGLLALLHVERVPHSTPRRNLCLSCSNWSCLWQITLHLNIIAVSSRSLFNPWSTHQGGTR